MTDWSPIPGDKGRRTLWLQAREEVWTAASLAAQQEPTKWSDKSRLRFWLVPIYPSLHFPNAEPHTIALCAAQEPAPGHVRVYYSHILPITAVVQDYLARLEAIRRQNFQERRAIQNRMAGVRDPTPARAKVREPTTNRKLTNNGALTSRLRARVLRQQTDRVETERDRKGMVLRYGCTRNARKDYERMKRRRVERAGKFDDNVSTTKRRHIDSADIFRAHV